MSRLWGREGVFFWPVYKLPLFPWLRGFIFPCLSFENLYPDGCSSLIATRQLLKLNNLPLWYHTLTHLVLTLLFAIIYAGWIGSPNPR